MHATSPSSPGLFFGAQTAGIGQSAIAVRASTDLLRVGPLRLRYSAQLLPVVRLSNVERYTTIDDAGDRTYVLQGRTD
ncbi:MAG TPA: hypothetical protein VE861_16000, partial [Gemmatimonadaceae bacterium]|nr:hypothetical protein [Gemmatimonadaceae bacterium]